MARMTLKPQDAEKLSEALSVSHGPQLKRSASNVSTAKKKKKNPTKKIPHGKSAPSLTE